VAYAYTQDVPIDLNTQHAIDERIGADPIEGLIIHIVVQLPNGLRYIDVWESEEHCDRVMRERIRPAVLAVLSELNVRPDREPIEEELHVVGMMIGTSMVNAAR